MTTLLITPDFRLDLDRRCDDCRGSGALSHPSWLAYWRAVDAELNERGGSTADAEQRVKERLGLVEPSVPEEVTCGACNGAQRIPTEEGRELLAFVARYQGRS